MLENNPANGIVTPAPGHGGYGGGRGYGSGCGYGGGRGGYQKRKIEQLEQQV